MGALALLAGATAAPSSPADDEFTLAPSATAAAWRSAQRCPLVSDELVHLALGVSRHFRSYACVEPGPDGLPSERTLSVMDRRNRAPMLVFATEGGVSVDFKPLNASKVGPVLVLMESGGRGHFFQFRVIAARAGEPVLLPFPDLDAKVEASRVVDAETEALGDNAWWPCGPGGPPGTLRLTRMTAAPSGPPREPVAWVSGLLSVRGNRVVFDRIERASEECAGSPSH